MILNIYAIRDEKTGYLTPTCDQNDAAAMRNFAHACMNESSLFFTHGSDYTLMRIGQYDTDNGSITPCQPQSLLSGSDVKRGE